MLKIENVVTPSPEQMQAVIRGMRNPKNSWDRSDSEIIYISNEETLEKATYQFMLGENDETLCRKLAGAGPVHGKFMRMIPVYLDITAPLYWWKEFDTYKIGTVANSCSTMHKIGEKKFTMDDFSWEHLTPSNAEFLSNIIDVLNIARENYTRKEYRKDYWWQMIQLLPSSYNQKRTVMLNYEVLRDIYEYRRDHKLDEWHTFCDWIEELPMSYLITGKTQVHEPDHEKDRFKLVGLRWEKAVHKSKKECHEKFLELRGLEALMDEAQTNVIHQPDQEVVVHIDTSTVKTKKDLADALERYAKEEFEKGLKDLP